VIGTFCEYFGERGGAPSLPGGWISAERVRESNPIINSSVLVRRDLATWQDRCGLEDYDLWLRLAAEGRRFFNIPQCLVKHRLHSASAFNNRGRQDLPGLYALHGISKVPTVVTAYYPIQSKNSSEQYMKWIADFWPKMQCAVVFYTEPTLVPTFERIFAGRRAQIIGLSLTALHAFHKLPSNIWQVTKGLDTEGVILQSYMRSGMRRRSLFFEQ
jgi:hypothetical protein